MNVTTTRAVIIFWDEETEEVRRVVFGDPEEILPVFTMGSAEVFKQLKELAGRTYNSLDEVQEALDNLPIPGTVHNREAHGDDKRFKITYEVVKR